MSFILNFLDEALDTVTGRYDGQEDETHSEDGNAIDAVDGNKGEGEYRATDRR